MVLNMTVFPAKVVLAFSTIIKKTGEAYPF